MPSKWKAPFFPLSLLNSIRRSTSTSPPINTQCRAAVIVPQMIGANLAIHNDKDYVPVKRMSSFSDYYSLGID